VPLRSFFCHVLAVLAPLISLAHAQTADFTTTFNFGVNGVNVVAKATGDIAADSAGNLYGAGFDLNNEYIVYELSPTNDSTGSWTASILFKFNGTTQGSAPESGLILDSQGNLYGTTFSGGSGPCMFGGCGVVFELSPSGGSWTQTVLYNFQGGADGANPSYSTLALDAEGNLYGTTNFGGGTGCLKQGCGVLFRLTPPSQAGGSWTEAVLHRFGKVTGTQPAGKLLYFQGKIYGTTAYGGQYDAGTVYMSNLKRKVTVLHSFNPDTDGFNWFPGGVAADSSGNLYGFTYNSMWNEGAVFELTNNGGNWLETLLYTFTGFGDGGYPSGVPLLDDAGNLYGSSGEGGDLSKCVWAGKYHGCGVVFKLMPAAGGWTETVLHAFTDGMTPQDDDGAFPFGVVFGPGQKLYGITAAGGTGRSGACYNERGVLFGCGVAFRLAQ